MFPVKLSRFYNRRRCYISYVLWSNGVRRPLIYRKLQTFYVISTKSSWVRLIAYCRRLDYLILSPCKIYVEVIKQRD